MNDGRVVEGQRQRFTSAILPPYLRRSPRVAVVLPLKPERIVFRHVSAPHFKLTATFAAQAGKTRLTWRMLFESAAECEKVKRYAVEANEQNLDRLEEQLAKMTRNPGA